MDLLHELTVHDRRRRDRSIWRTALLLSALVHLIVFVGWRGTVIPTPRLAEGPQSPDNRPGGGGMRAMSIRPQTVQPIRRPPRPVEVSIDVKPVEFDFLHVDADQILGDAPGLGAPGAGSGSGSGGPGSGGGGHSRIEPPTPKGMIVPPANKKLKGTTVQVWVFVDQLGRVVADSTRLEPPTGDGDFDKRLISEAAEWLFRPAMRAGTAVASWFPYRISM